MRKGRAASAVLLAGLLLALTASATRHGSQHPSLLCQKLVLALGYPCEDHQVITEDGFILGVQRIPSGRSNGSEPIELRMDRGMSDRRPPVLLQHGLMQGADCFLLNDPPSESLGLMLADAGFDVWLGNTRGSRWSHGHQTLEPRDKAYWDWSWDELAAYDLPAMLGLVSAETGGGKVSYVGHSQGTLIALAGLKNPKVSELMAAAVMLCPIAYLKHMTSKFLQVMAHVYLDKVVQDSGWREFNLNTPRGERLVGEVCARKEVDCTDLLSSITGRNCCINMSRVPHYFEYEIDSTSVKNMAHFCQMVRRGMFAKYDYGFVLNMLHYGSSRPPVYSPADLPSDIPIMLAFGGMDALADPRDVRALAASLPQVPEQLYVADYAHGDFVLSTRAKEDVYDRVALFLVRTMRELSL